MLNIGDKYGNLTVIERLGKNSKYRQLYKFKCDCGNFTIKQEILVKRGYTKSCGCLKPKTSIENLKNKNNHKMSKTRFYKIWKAMLRRCYGKNQLSYKNYGERGIKVCDNWKDFNNFYSDMYQSYLEHVEKYGEKNTSIDRIDVNGNYTKENCKWSTRVEQANNTRRNHMIKYKDKYVTMAELGRITNINYSTIRHHVYHNTLDWLLEKHGYKSL